MRKVLLGIVLSCLFSFSAFGATDDVVKSGHPQSYTVKRGDTLWDISSMFLSKPWMWPEIWHVNPEIKNPHKIYPGDVISLVYVDGKPRLMLGKRGAGGRTIRLSPKIRSTPIDTAIPSIPLNAISSFLKRSRIIDNTDGVSKAPYVIASRQERIVTGAGDIIYARGQFPEDAQAMGVFRKGRDYTDPKTKEYLGTVVHDIGIAKIKSVSGDVGTVSVMESNQEIRVGDRLLETEETAVQPTFYPSAPKQTVEGEILSVIGGVTQIGQFDNVLINLGGRNGMVSGTVLSINRVTIVNDSLAKQKVQLPPEHVGTLMVYKAFDKMSYGIVLKALQPINTGDMVTNP
ncbi:LysM peptidoglycan-binding domain-containing protein [Zooshikella harenae]|uniref:LysM peptidoglycan-binding domain-containing protein n=1 Tax=Zooshikella harenae TaxID=2827238 RepID=A0ABS5ZCV8_9GAMM|nr:LysM peptidoglycan-binding domain-containing protein [Zooshikella harenae]MBU2711703.1 LysM peptidoglycan-binding domain-containing protein [Zooshikella harenae]